MKAMHSIITLLIITAVVQIVHYYPRLPEVVASHFDGLGDPNGWSSKIVFFGIYIAVLCLTIIIFVVLPSRINITSGKGFKIPNKEYWLAPERRNETIRFYKKHFIYFGIANTLLAILVIQLVIQANFAANNRLDNSIVWVLGLYFLFVIVWLISFFLKFKRRT